MAAELLLSYYYRHSEFARYLGARSIVLKNLRNANPRDPVGRSRLQICGLGRFWVPLSFRLQLLKYGVKEVESWKSRIKELADATSKH